MEHTCNVRCAYLAFRVLVNLFSELVDERKKLEEKTKELEHVNSRIESALTFVGEQPNTLRTALPASMPSPAFVASMVTHPI